MLSILILIIDAKTAYTGAIDGINLCLRTIIPVLFPFIVLSAMLNSYLLGSPLSFLKPLSRLCDVPDGAESLLLLGFIGGYPVGAQCLNEAFESKILSKEDAKRMLVFCNNAGPSFIFGLCGALFDSVLIPFALWIIHIASALMVGICLKNDCKPSTICNITKSITLPQALDKGIKTTAAICGWVILFRIMITFLQKWFLWALPQPMQTGIIGMLELSNGCCDLFAVPQHGQRFIMCAFMLGFGGICVAMQTASVAKLIFTPIYIIGKLLQAVISFTMASILQFFIFPNTHQWHLPAVIYIITIIICVSMFIVFRKNSSISKRFHV